MRRLGLILVLPAVLMALTADLWSGAVAGFTYSEIHPALSLAPPGARDVPRRHRDYDGQPSSFDLLDVDGDGLLRFDEGESPEVLAARLAFRPCLFALSAGSGGQADRLRDLPPACLPEGNTSPTPQEVIEATRWMRHDQALLLDFDQSGDHCVDRDEYPGAPLTRAFLLGTDASGRDLSVRLFYGARASLLVALLAALISLLLGAAVGLLAAHLGGTWDRLIMRLVDILYGLPLLFVVMLVYLAVREIVQAWEGLGPEGSSLLQASILFLALGAIQWPTAARLVRGSALDVQARGFVRAAHAMGQTPGRVLGRHVLPHVLPTLLSYGVLLVPSLMLEEAFLSFLGFGIQPPYPSFGTLIREGLGILDLAPRAAMSPLLILSLATLGLHLLRKEDGHE